MRTIDIVHVAPLFEELLRSLEKGREDEAVTFENERPLRSLCPSGPPAASE
ncbi:MAG TPA: hypothetical protein VIP51_10480 [Eoetvoesiella sp.]